MECKIFKKKWIWKFLYIFIQVCKDDILWKWKPESGENKAANWRRRKVLHWYLKNGEEEEIDVFII